MDIIEKLPGEVIAEVLKYIEVDDLIRLGMNTKNPIIQHSIISQISKYLISLNNRIKNLTHLGMYILTRSYLVKSKVHLLENFKLIFDLFTLNQQMGSPLSQEITISYYIWDLVDFNQFLNMLLSLKNFGKITFNIEIEFDPSILGIINLDFLFDMLFHLNFLPSVTSLLITNFHGNFNFDITKFINLERLWLINSDIKFIHPLDLINNLQQIHIFPNVYGYNRNNSIIIKTLPQNITMLSLGNIIVKNFKSFPSRLQTIKLKFVKDLTGGEIIFNLINTSIKSKALQRLIIKDLINIKDSINYKISSVLSSYLPNLVEVSIQNFYYDAPVEMYNNLSRARFLKLINLRISNTVFGNFSNIYENVVKLNITNNNIKSLQNIPFSNGLRELYISYNPIDWSEEVKLPAKLIRLELRNTGLGDHLFKLKLPESLKVLGLEVNDITSIENFKFPKNITNLGLGSNKIRFINHHYLPPNLIILHLTENYINGEVDFTKNADGEELNIFSIYLNHNNITTLKGFQFPKSIKVLNFDDNLLKAIKNIDFPSNLFELSVVGCNLTEVSFNCENLNILNLSNNKLKLLSTNLPKNLNQLFLNYNRFEYIDKDYFKNLSFLKYLSISNNKLTYAKFTFSETLTNLDLSNNSISKIQLSFNENVLNSTNLMSINLSGNNLLKLDTKDIGHKLPILHSNLSEIDLSENNIREQDIDLKAFPPNLKVFIIGHRGDQDQFGYEIGKNIIPNPLCTGKRIES